MNLERSNIFKEINGGSSNKEKSNDNGEVLILDKYRKYLKKVDNLPPWMKLRNSSNGVICSEWYTVDESFSFDDSDEDLVNFILNKLYSLEDSVVTHKLCIVDGDLCISFILPDNSKFYIKYSETKFYIIENSIIHSKYYKDTLSILINCVREFRFDEFEIV